MENLNSDITEPASDLLNNDYYTNTTLLEQQYVEGKSLKLELVELNIKLLLLTSDIENGEVTESGVENIALNNMENPSSHITESDSNPLNDCTNMILLEQQYVESQSLKLSC